MPEKTYRVYSYRWVILLAFSLVNLSIQMLWICFAPVTGPAAQFYRVSDQQIGFLAMSFMIVYVPLSIPISWMIDTLGYRKAVNIGVVLMAVFGLLRGFSGASYPLVMITTLGLAVAQPFMMNAISTVAARWFPIQERATASGLALVASFIGIAIGQVTSPMLITSYNIPTMLLVFGASAALTSVLFLVLARDAPPTPPCPPDQAGRALVFDGLKSMLAMKDIWLLLVLFLVGLGIFNGVTTWIEEIVRPKGFSIQQAGNLGGFLLLGGIFGAIIIPALSDHFRRRKLFLMIGLALTVPSLLGVTFAATFDLMVASMLALGFSLMSLAPIGYQYAAEITYPAPEGTSNGLLNLAGQVSVVFVYAMQAVRGADGTFTLSLVILAVLIGICSLLVTAMRESTLLTSLKPK